MEASEVDATDGAGHGAGHGASATADTNDVEWEHSGQSAFYYHIYVDADQIIRPWLKPRGERMGGPYRDYETAEREARKQPHTHYSISKVTVRAGIQIPFKEETFG